MREWELRPHLGPPAGEHEVGVHVLLPELLGHVEPQRAVLVVDVSFRGVRQDGVGVVDLLINLSAASGLSGFLSG